MAEAKVIKGVLNSRSGDDGEVMYKVRYDGMDKSADEWVKADAVSEEHIANFEKRKAKKAAQQSAPKPQEEKKRKAESEPQGQEDGAEQEEEDEEGGGESKGSRLEYDDGGIGVEAGEVDPSLIIDGPRRKRKAAAKAEQSSEWTNLLAGKLSALGDSESDSD